MTCSLNPRPPPNRRARFPPATPHDLLLVPRRHYPRSSRPVFPPQRPFFIFGFCTQISMGGWWSILEHRSKSDPSSGRSHPSRRRQPTSSQPPTPREKRERSSFSPRGGRDGVYSRIVACCCCAGQAGTPRVQREENDLGNNARSFA